MNNRKPMTTLKLRKMKQEGTPITMITAYDYPSAKLADEAGMDMILVGDSLGNVVLGYDSTLPVTLEDMIYHSRPVNRAVSSSFVVTDMPFLTYHGSLDSTLFNVGRIIREGGSKAVKMEGGREIAKTVEAVVNAGVPVVGHVGLTPQSVHQLGGYRVQGKNSEQIRKLFDDVIALEQAGAFAIVLELVTDDIAAEISSKVNVPTIGIGSGSSCDGQVLVFHDLLQYGSEVAPKRFVKTYADIGAQIRQAISTYGEEVRSRQFPAKEHAFQSSKEQSGSKPTTQEESTSLYGN
ncbi:MAG: 3-methyl-2-oxobutanoate hydroxymethyltransferase [Gorillibacterium sp.]|nr:3-methyl-2-oxobutanoate hydroxymethyltransferase [Gorillibacterium sp.]